MKFFALMVFFVTTFISQQSFASEDKFYLVSRCKVLNKKLNVKVITISKLVTLNEVDKDKNNGLVSFEDEKGDLMTYFARVDYIDPFHKSNQVNVTINNFSGAENFEIYIDHRTNTENYSKKRNGHLKFRENLENLKCSNKYSGMKNIF